MKHNDYKVLGAMGGVLILAAAATYVLTTRDQSVDTPTAADIALTAQTSVYTDLYGNTIPLESFIGQPLVVFAWASWCPECASLLPQLERIAADPAFVNVTFLGINRAERGQTARAYINSRNFDPEHLTLVLDPVDHYFDTIEGYTMPEILVYRPDGTVAHHLRTPVQRQQLRQHLELLTAQ